MKVVILTALYLTAVCHAVINRQAIVSRYNPVRNASSLSTPMQVGNGNFAFGADVTGLQTFQPFGILSSWGWKNDSLPAGKTQQDILNYKGVSWLNHGRPVEYDFGGGNPIEQWLISSPNRVNLGRVGLMFWTKGGDVQTVDENDLTAVGQELDLWAGKITSRFEFEGNAVTVEVASAQDSDTIGIIVNSGLLGNGRIGLFLDFPWNDGSAKFSAPFVGNWNATANHTTTLNTKVGGSVQAEITHKLDAATFLTSVGGDRASVARLSPAAHRYSVRPIGKSSTLSLAVAFGKNKITAVSRPLDVFQSSAQTWKDYWTKSGFVDVLTGSTDTRANELQRRIILSRYLMRVNEAGDTPPQESGLVNNGWYGKFHMEMFFWHSAHWGLWSNWDLLQRSSSVYSRFLPSSIHRAQVQQGWSAGARWPKMTDPSGRSAPGEINNLLIWQQPHPLIFAQYEYRAFPTNQTLAKWEAVVEATADWMAAFAWKNTSTGVYDLGPPMYVVSEDTSPNVTMNSAFELAYWRLGLSIAEGWMEALGKEVPKIWTDVKEGLAQLPVDNGTYAVYEGIESNFWTDPAYTSDHPALVGLHGWLPPTDGLDVGVAKATAEKVWTHWNVTDFWGWDFPMLAMSAARNGDPSKAVDWLLDPLFLFDDVGMPVGGVRVPTPYFPGAGALLYSVAMMAAGWDGSQTTAPGFPKDGWNVRVEGISKVL
ncbi:Six-hairpin glycosidase-like protein [Crucibulum laeve]|uniref:Six-hairpin glycosidase-like protein n=1 Tax=Crucibulum laeve TaxID=68775 RepID=A0A5C3LWG2_9AGAR|nr:Six-hairpin glycosidase-like protein [Crucibulum laeve]